MTLYTKIDTLKCKKYLENNSNLR